MSYECLNPQCFYEGALLSAQDVCWVNFYNHEIGDLELRSTCPSCSEPMAIWDERPDTEVNEDATLQKTLFV